MAIPFTKVIYSEVLTNRVIDVSSFISFSSQEGLDGTTNNLQATLKNPFGAYSSGGNKLTRFIEGDTIQVYADNSPIDTTATTQVIRTYTVRKVTGNIETDRTISLELVDNTYLLLSGLWSGAYDFTNTSGAPTNTPQTIINIVLARAYNKNGQQITAALKTSGGYVQDYKQSAYTTGSAEDGTIIAGHPVAADYFPNYRCGFGHAFYSATSTITGAGQCGSPGCTSAVYYGIIYPLLFKTVYDALKELSMNYYTGWDSTKSYVFYMDNTNAFHWYYPSDTLNSSTIIEGALNVKMINLTLSTFDAYNMVIYNAGTDKNGNGIIGMQYDPTAGTGVPKGKYIPMINIARDLQKVLTDKGTYASTSNDDFRNQVRAIASGYALDMIRKFGHPRIQGSIRLRGTSSFRPGDLVSVTSASLGLSAYKLRVQDVQHTFSSADWQTTLQVQEDDYAIFYNQTVS